MGSLRANSVNFARRITGYPIRNDLILNGILPFVPEPIRLTKADTRRALVAYHLAPTTLIGAFERLRSIQFDPLSPVGCNHDLVLQARVKCYKVGDWQRAAYEDRFIYDGWDKQASLVPFTGWPLRQVYYDWHRYTHRRIFNDYPHAVKAVLAELEQRGPLLPKEFEFQERKEEWKSSWHGPNLTKQTLRALWHAGEVMTSGRRNGHHVYDLTQRIVPSHLLSQPKLPERDAFRELAYERHLAMGMLRPTASYEVWSLHVPNVSSGEGWSLGSIAGEKKAALEALVSQERIVPVEVDGMRAHATPEFLAMLDSETPKLRVVFIAPLDQIMWDRKMVAQVFEFDYIWEVYVPEPKRKWGYYVLPVLYGDKILARVEFWCRDQVLEIRCWHWEQNDPVSPKFMESIEEALLLFLGYAQAKQLVCRKGVDKKIADLCNIVKCE